MRPKDSEGEHKELPTRSRGLWAQHWPLKDVCGLHPDTVAPPPRIQAPPSSGPDLSLNPCNSQNNLNTGAQLSTAAGWELLNERLLIAAGLKLECCHVSYILKHKSQQREWNRFLKYRFSTPPEIHLSVYDSSAGPAPDGAPPLPAHPGQGDAEWERHRPERLALRPPSVLQSLQWYENTTLIWRVCGKHQNMQILGELKNISVAADQPDPGRWCVPEQSESFEECISAMITLITVFPRPLNF